MTKLAARFKKKSDAFLARLKKKRLPKKFVYYANPKLHIPYNITMPSQSFYDMIEQHLRTEVTILPVTKVPLTWKKFVRHNPGFKRLKNDIIRAERRNYPDRAWDRVARNVARLVKKHHMLIK